MDIVNYSSRSVDTQMRWKARFNGYLGEAIRDVPESDRVILDTGDSAAVCFLGAPELAMFAGCRTGSPENPSAHSGHNEKFVICCLWRRLTSCGRPVKPVRRG